MAVISQSEVDTYLGCRRRHFYAHGEKIAPIQYGVALTRGLIGHEALADAFNARKSGASLSEMKSVAMDKLGELMVPENMTVVAELGNLLTYFFDNADWIKNWEILEVEKEYRVPVPNTEGLTFPFKVDLLIRDKANGNRMMVVDNKFVQDFYRGDLISILPQMAKYVGALKMLDMPVKDAYYNMIRTRPLINKPVTEKLKLEICNLSQAKIDHYLREQFAAMKQINALKTKVSMDDWRDKYALRSANQFNCRTCPFLDLCSLDLVNGNRELHIKAFYQENTYGYEEEVDNG